MTREIELSRGLVALVDASDYDWLMTGGKWNARGRPGNYYAGRTRWEGDRCFGETMHRLILPDAFQVDHVNGDALDNRRANLRVATSSQNAANRKKRSDSKNKYKGIRPAQSGNGWIASITARGHQRHLGTFPTEEEAALAYDHAAVAAFGEYARTNFPEGDI